jgi:hypothetical protein
MMDCGEGKSFAAPGANWLPRLERLRARLIRFVALRPGGFMRFRFVLVYVAVCIGVCMIGLTSLAASQQPASQAPAMQQPTMPTGFGEGKKSGDASADALRDMWEAKIKGEWEALKNKDEKAYGELLADDYQGVEVDGRGERNKIQALAELAASNVSNYTLWGLKVIPAGPDAALVIYESTMQFPPKSAVRYSRVYISELWEKRGGQWKEVHYQETHVK